ncbi:proline--tRNA ligase [Helicobacter saguini]|uniref:Proline--tRNA ligase n=1 Tax=Helicobacter saguini TaxID=1548018 RepID=A0A347VRX5_9HELI|nr:proline--tRNA ligase [Helicobacter saguini]MWV62740.1 proline--tRNA ligase [Helicobacter saguini]MWV66589.1 proline--tRNA ligase [Helicobacter saguini]MWV68940.1 proline--tRNA ligase [Helicobacter saguini]MWV71506.1 proline--tRNA ligase [Helicobacter saguini]TLD92208.1 proline--tRNA ligase [Helicobacter saguini]
MKFSEFFAPTLKEVPKECVLKSHIYLLRAGYIHQIGSGIYNFLPLGKIMLEKIKNIVKKRMDEAGANEIMMGFLTPASLWEKSGRYEKYSELAIFKDRKDAEFVLGPTHEECAAEIAKTYIKSYKQLPLNLYQIHLKFRDELRPRFGLLRAREFVMKDAYSFHADETSLNDEFINMREAYRKIFTDLGLDFRIVEADSGAIGGSGSREFMVLAECGEDTLVVCSKCDYASNIEAAKRAKRVCDAVPPQATSAYHKFATPNVKTIENLSEFFKVDTFYLIKAVVKKAIFKDREQIAVFFMRGKDKLESTKALNALKALDSEVLDVVDAEAEFLQKHNLPQGSIGPIHLRAVVDTPFIVFDNELQDAEDLICGANEHEFHYVGVNLGEFKDLVYADLVAVEEGDLCACCGSPLIYKKGIEVGHIFKLGVKYSKPLNAEFLDSNGRSQPFIMGCYGIGVSRLLSAILEQKADSKGCVWGNLSPFKLDIIISNVKDSKQFEFAFDVYEKARGLGIEVIIDDRNERFGAKINDFELIGFEYALIVGKGLESNVVELIKRAGLEKREIDSKEILEYIKTL